jgi:transposase-like protein
MSIPNPTSQLLLTQSQAIAALAMGRNISSAARIAGVHRSTVHDWLTQPAFQSALAEAQHQYFDLHQDELREIAALALDTIRQLLENAELPPALRLRAALAVLDRPLFPTQIVPASTLSDTPQPRVAPAPPPHPVEIARNAPCPCGSGNKYKRCCGANAPPVLSKAAA